MIRDRSKGIFGLGVLDGSILQASAPVKSATDRKLLGVFVGSSEELRAMRRNVLSNLLVAAYLGTIIERLPRFPIA